MSLVVGRIRDLGRDRPLVVIDDDPTGTQTIRDLDVMLAWDADLLSARIARSSEPFFLLANSRSMPAQEAEEFGRSIGEALKVAELRTGKSVTVVSRGDSTLRGHFPGEVDALSLGLERPDARILLAPYLGDAQRITVGDVQLARVDDAWVPVHQTEFALDARFGYRSANLRDWIVERGAG